MIDILSSLLSTIPSSSKRQGRMRKPRRIQNDQLPKNSTFPSSSSYAKTTLSNGASVYKRYDGTWGKDITRALRDSLLYEMDVRASSEISPSTERIKIIKTGNGSCGYHGIPEIQPIDLLDLLPEPFWKFSLWNAIDFEQQESQIKVREPK
ncbi:hypothetical protein ACTXT7_011520 [Hymenolepis weldensis]